MKRALLLLALFGSLFCLPGALTAGAEETTADIQPGDIETLVKQLEGDQSAAAARQLQKIGAPAVPAVAKGADGKQIATIARYFDVLGQMQVSDDEATAKAASEALEELAKSETEIVARRARTMIRLKPVMRMQKEAREKAGIGNDGAGAAEGRVSKFTWTGDGKSLQLTEAADGSFSGTVTETVDGKEKVTQVQVANEKELEEKYPDAHKLYLKQPAARQRQVQRARNPALNGANRVPGIQIGGNVQVGGDRIAISSDGTKRKIDAQSGDDRVEITDTNGKDIQLKHTRTVDGKKKTDEYQGTDLDDLKKKHPEAAKLYEKYAANNNIVVRGPGGAGGGIQIQVQANGGVVGRGPVIQAVPNNPDRPAGTGPRTIRSVLNGRKVEISDDDGKQIKIKVTQTVDGKDVTEEFSAETFDKLKSEHPAAAELYEKLAGR